MKNVDSFWVAFEIRINDVQNIAYVYTLPTFIRFDRALLP